MDKKLLRKIECEEPDGKFFEDAEKGKYKYAVKVMYQKGDNKPLCMTFYRVSRKKAVLRTFLGKNDYITLRLSDKRWLTGAFDSPSFPIGLYELRYDYPHWEYEDAVFMSETDKKVLKEFLSAYINGGLDEENVFLAVYRYQRDIKNERLDEKHIKEKEKIDGIMAEFGELPKGFKEWCRETVLKKARYLGYRNKGKKTEVICSYCGHEGETEGHYSHNEKTVCPFCGSMVTAKARGRMKRIYYPAWAGFIERHKKGFALRLFECRRTGVDFKTEPDGMWELGRIIYTPLIGGGFKKEVYEFMPYKNTDEIRWCENKGLYYSELQLKCMLYPNNLPEAWEHTKMRYSALEIASKREWIFNNIDTAINQYTDFPGIEQLIKMGLYRIADEVLNGFRVLRDITFNKEGRNIFDILRLNKENTKMLCRQNGSIEMLRVLQISQGANIRWKENELIEFTEVFGAYEELIYELRNTTYHRLMKFIEGQKGYFDHADGLTQTQKKLIARDWMDYLSWRRDMSRDIKSECNYYPKNFRAVHDREYRDYAANINEINKRKKDEEERLIKERADAFESFIAGKKGRNTKTWCL